MARSDEPPGQRAKGEAPSPPVDPPGPLLPLATRVALFVVSAIVLRSVLGAAALRLLADADQLAALEQAAREGTALDFGLILAAQAATLPLLVLATLWWMRRIDRGPIAGLGVGVPRLRWQAAAVVLAAALLGLWLATVSPALDFTFVPTGVPATTLALFAAGFLAAAAIEEWIHRGYVYSTLRERLGWVHAAAVSSLLFGFLPVLLFAEELALVELLVVLLVGLLLAELRELAGEVWTPALFHGTWNFLLGCILSLPVSGLEPPSLFAVTVDGAESWSGGERGPEASWPLALLLLAVVLGAAGWIEHRRARDGG